MFGEEEGSKKKNVKTKGSLAALHALHRRSGATCVVHHVFTYSSPVRWHKPSPRQPNDVSAPQMCSHSAED